MNFTVEIRCCTLFQGVDANRAEAGGKVFLNGVIYIASVLFQVAGG